MICVGVLSWTLVRTFGLGEGGREKFLKRPESTSNFKPVQGTGEGLESINTNVLLSHSKPCPLTQNLADTPGFPKSRGFPRAPGSEENKILPVREAM